MDNIIIIIIAIYLFLAFVLMVRYLYVDHYVEYSVVNALTNAEKDALKYRVFWIWDIQSQVDYEIKYIKLKRELSRHKMEDRGGFFS